jgi:hypothetical protein
MINSLRGRSGDLFVYRHRGKGLFVASEQAGLVVFEYGDICMILKRKLHPWTEQIVGDYTVLFISTGKRAKIRGDIFEVDFEKLC